MWKITVFAGLSAIASCSARSENCADHTYPEQTIEFPVDGGFNADAANYCAECEGGAFRTCDVNVSDAGMAQIHCPQASLRACTE